MVKTNNNLHFPANITYKRVYLYACRLWAIVIEPTYQNFKSKNTIEAN
ncbi:MAG: hypothetical protein ABFR32_12145 [Bacteroidota bacterium]